jgi:hypothetical protein
MKPVFRYLFLCSTIGAVLLCGCLSSYKEVAHRHEVAANLPQLVRFYSIQKVKKTPGTLFISGAGSAAADGGKSTFTKRTPLSSYPAIEMTIKSDNSAELDSCQERVQAVQENHKSIDIRGMGTFTIVSVIDPPLDTGVFVLAKLDACGEAVPPPPASAPTASTATVPAAHDAIPAADLVAVPERYLDQRVVISGHLAAPVHFMDPVSSFLIESEGQTLSAYFITTTLAAESRLALVHATPGSNLILEGALTHIAPKSLASQSGAPVTTGYEFDVSNVISVGAMYAPTTRQ